ncbi:GDSL-type esterase/lipase family protein [Belliella sp. DSM 107340]|uniref:GDSL-type esterase/lipase family protein n=1 Tax=Belliella calami TaxID=2923436 RepID=A0ABS9UTN7_9BACT|nr:GDSL-type esterase/lipase family protein [Belliella calami]MCH7399623.1 GDSL-type esterase/lipase family protein [Belliella calami]
MKPLLKYRNLFLAFFFLLFIAFNGYAQGQPFQNEINSILDKYPENSYQKGGIVFTGSSSIRLWENLEEDIPNNKIINTGFGGSQTHELLFYIEETILRYSPSKVFIYVGENDIQEGKAVKQILQEYKALYKKIISHNPNTELFFISAKPSPSRWEKQKQFEQLNEKTLALCQQLGNMTFINIWDEMLDENGRPKEGLFVQDKLHMNKKGYAIWANKITPHL